MTILEHILCALSMGMGVACAFFVGWIISLRCHVAALEDYITSLENSLYR